MPEAGLYRHYKGGLYVLRFLAVYEAGRPRPSVTVMGERLCVYQCQETGKHYVRPASEWSETVSHGGSNVTRFTPHQRPRA